MGEWISLICVLLMANVDTVLLAMGWSPDASRGEELSDICRVIPVGDSSKCRNILAATSEAYEAVVSI